MNSFEKDCIIAGLKTQLDEKTASEESLKLDVERLNRVVRHLQIKIDEKTASEESLKLDVERLNRVVRHLQIKIDEEKITVRSQELEQENRYLKKCLTEMENSLDKVNDKIKQAS